MMSFLKSWYTAISFSWWILKPDMVKTMGTCGEINAIWYNIKINLQKFVDVYEYELQTNLQNFMQKDLTEVKYSNKF